MLYNMCHVILYNRCYVMLYNICCVMLCYITCVILFYITCVMLCYITCVVLCYITCVMLCCITYVMLYNILYVNECHVMFYNMCHVMLCNMCHVMLYYYRSDSLWKIWLVESIQLIHNSLWTWHDKCNICCRYCIYHVKFNVCLVTTPLGVFSSETEWLNRWMSFFAFCLKSV